jgi:hypothetical protein
MFLALLGIETSIGHFNCTALLNYMNINKVLRISLFHYNFKKELIIFFTRIIEFVPNSNIDTFNFQKITINFTDTIKKSFDNLSIDKYYSEIRYRSFSLIDTNHWITIGHPIFYNNYCENNNMNNNINEYTHISSDVLKDDSFRDMINEFILSVNTFEKIYSFVYVHQIRVECNDNEINALPEGIHKDGFEFIGIYCVSRKNIKGGITQLYDNDLYEIFNDIIEEDTGLIINDSKYSHSLTPISPMESNKESNETNSCNSYRDIFIITTVS